MRFVIVAATMVLAVACTKESTAPPAQVAEAPVAAAKPVEEAKPVEGEKVSFDQSAGKVDFNCAKVTGAHDGGFNTFTGELVLPNGGIAGGAVNVTIQMDSVWSDNDRLTGHLKSDDFFDVANIPTSTFKSTEIVAAGEGFTVTGDLTLHNVTKRITFPAKIAVASDKVSVDASFSINRKDFGIVYPGKPDDLIRDAVDMKLALAIPRAVAQAQ